MAEKSKRRSSSSASKKALPKDIEERHTREFIGTDKVSHTATPYYHGVYDSIGVDNSFSFTQFKENFRIEIQSSDNDEIVFDMIGIDAPIANAFRRILIAEVPTMCIESVYFRDNTSLIPDEVFAHRLGLIPLRVDPRDFDYKLDPTEDYTETNTITFKLTVECTQNPNTNESDPEHIRYSNSRVFSGDLVWEAQGDQDQRYTNIRPVSEEILLAKLRPGQSIDISCYCQKGLGKDHAKFSPVCTATYRLLPEIVFPNPIKNKDAEKLEAMCPMKVFDIEDLGKGEKRARVANPRNCTMCRECIRHPGWAEKVKLRRVKNHYIFSVESTGVLPPHEIVEEAFKVFLEKIQVIKAAYESLRT